MAIVAAHSLGLFGAVWALFCVGAGALVTDTLMRDGHEAAQATDETPRKS